MSSSGRPFTRLLVIWPLCPRGGSSSSGSSNQNNKRRRPVVQLPTVVCISPTARRWLRITVQYGLLAFILLILIIWLGAEYEDYHVRQAADTLRFYEMPAVCGMIRTTTTQTTTTTTTASMASSVELPTRGTDWNQSTINNNNNSQLIADKESLETRTFASKEEALAYSNSTVLSLSNHTSYSAVPAAAAVPATATSASLPQTNNRGTNTTASTATTSSTTSSSSTTTTTATMIAHCGNCGACSTPHDIRIYDDTKNTLLGTTLHCAKRSFIWGRRTASKCLAEQVGFSGDCETCWVENIICDLRKCVFTCIWQGLFNQVDTGSDSQKLNRCTQCDELRCGPAFVTCAGANRRRSGILSDIERDQQQEVCHAVTPDAWWKDDSLLQLWETQQQQQKQESSPEQQANNDKKKRRPKQQQPSKQPAVRDKSPDHDLLRRHELNDDDKEEEEDEEVPSSESSESATVPSNRRLLLLRNRNQQEDIS